MKPLPRFLLGLLLGLPIGQVFVIVVDIVCKTELRHGWLWLAIDGIVGLVCLLFGNWEPQGFARAILKGGVIGIPPGWLAGFVAFALVFGVNEDKDFVTAVWGGILIGIPIGAFLGACCGLSGHWLLHRPQPTSAVNG